MNEEHAGKGLAKAFLLVASLLPYLGFLGFGYHAWKAWAASWLVTRLAVTAGAATLGGFACLCALHVLTAVGALVAGLAARATARK